MKKAYAAFKSVRLLIIVLGIPLILIELVNPGLVDLTWIWEDRYIIGIRADFICQIIVVGSELLERFIKLKEARFYLFSPRVATTFKRLSVTGLIKNQRS